MRKAREGVKNHVAHVSLPVQYSSARLFTITILLRQTSLETAQTGIQSMLKDWNDQAA